MKDIISPQEAKRMAEGIVEQMEIEILSKKLIDQRANDPPGMSVSYGSIQAQLLQRLIERQLRKRNEPHT